MSVNGYTATEFVGLWVGSVVLGTFCLCLAALILQAYRISGAVDEDGPGMVGTVVFSLDVCGLLYMGHWMLFSFGWPSLVLWVVNLFAATIFTYRVWFRGPAKEYS